MSLCNFHFWGCLSKVTRLLLFMIIFKANTVAYKMKKLRPWFRYHAPITFENVKKVTRLYLHASVSGYTCMQAYPGGNTKRGNWVYVFFMSMVYFWLRLGHAYIRLQFFSNLIDLLFVPNNQPSS